MNAGNFGLAAGLAALAVASPAFAGPEKVPFPADYLKGELQNTVLAQAAAPGGAKPAPAATAQASPASSEAAIEGFQFKPAQIIAAVGRAITWRNRDDAPHQITVVGQTLRSGLIQKNQTANLTFDKAGKYDYVCGLHPNMKGTIEVR